MFLQMWFSSHRLRNLKADVYGTKMLIYLSMKWVTMQVGKFLVCLFSLNFQANIQRNRDKRHMPHHNKFIILLI